MKQKKKWMYSLIMTVAVMVAALCTQTIRADAFIYNPKWAADYALTYWQNGNPNYTHYPSGDGVNFVSQCLYAGGMPVTDDWKPYTEYWRNTSLVNYLVNQGGTLIKNPSASQIEVGDVLAYRFSGTSGYDNMAICTEVINGTPWICKRSSNLHTSNWTLGTSNYWVIKMKSFVGYNPAAGCYEWGGGYGSVHVRGYAYDLDDVSQNLDVLVTIGGDSYSNAPRYTIKANTYNDLVEGESPGAGYYHGYDSVIETDMRGAQKIYVYAINVGKGTDVYIGCYDVNILTPVTATVSSSELTVNVGATVDVTVTYAGDGVEDVTAETSPFGSSTVTRKSFDKTNKKCVFTIKGGSEPESDLVTIEFKDANGSRLLRKQISVSVKSPLKGISLGVSEVNLRRGTTETLQVTYNPANTTDSKTVTWSSTDKTVATVSSSGVVTPVGGGTCQIKATVGNYFGVCTVNVPWEISYNANGGSGAPGKTYLYPTGNTTLSSTIPTKTGYLFKGWNTKADGSGYSYDSGAFYGTSGDVIMYARWEAETYHVYYQKGESTVLSVPASQTKVYGADLVLSTELPVKKGYNFIEWYAEKDDKTISYAPGSTYSENRDLYLKPRWELATYKINYELDGGSFDGAFADDYQYDRYNQDILIYPKKTGYNFGGYYLDPKDESTRVEGVPAGSTGDLTLYVKWTPISYRISFDGNSADKGNMDTMGLDYDTTYTLTANSFTKRGYSFKGWNTKADGSGTAYANKDQVKNLTASGGTVIYLYAQWKPVDYKITYELDGGSNSSGNPASYQVTTSTITFKNPSKTGYTFKGWYEDEAFTTRVKEIPQGSTGHRVLYAKWQVNVYGVLFDGNGATGGEVLPLLNRKYDTEFVLRGNSFTRTGYTFSGWNTKTDGSGSSYSNKAAVSKLTAVNGAEVTLYAQWKPNVYTVKFNGNGADGGSAKTLSSCEYGKKYTLSANGFYRTGYAFAGWNTQTDGSGVTYADKQSVSNLTDKNAATVTLYAQWKVNQYNIVFDGNGASSGSMSQMNNRIYGTDYILTANAFKRTGYNMVGWNTAADGSGSAYANKQVIRNLSEKDGETVILYAQWQARKYSIAFDGNGASSGSMAVMSGCEYGTFYVLTANTFKRSGYKLSGWNTAADGSGTGYANKASVKNLTSTEGKTVTLYAQWEATVYSISYELNGGVNASSNPVSYTIETPAITLKNPSKTGYTFKGWYNEENFTTKVTKVNAGSTGSRVFYAKWTANQYTIAFDGNGATSGELADLPGREYDRIYTLRTNAFKKTGYTFAGWNTRADGSGNAYADKDQVSNLTTGSGETVVLYAQWTANTYSIKFNGNGSDSGSTKTMSGCFYDTSYILKTNGFKKTGYTFLGWNTAADGSGKSFADKKEVKNLSAANGSSVTLYAQWRVNVYSIVFDGNGAESGAMNTLSNRVYGNSYTLPINAFKKTGYTFLGWNTNADGSGTVIENRQSVQNLTAVDGATVTLYAQWKARTYSISFDGNGAGSGAMDVMSNCVYDSSYNLAANAYKRTGYSFSGWNTKADGSGTRYANKATVSNLANTEGKVVILYAQWKANVYSITYEVNGGVNAGTNPGSYTIESDTILLASPSKMGYTFKGWYKESTFATKVTKINIGSTGNKTFYAKWAANTYTAAFDGNGASSGSTAELTGRTYDKDFTLRTNGFKRTGYEFAGWNTRADGKGTSYADKASVRNLTTENGAVVTLYAQWKAVEYAISYTLNGGINPAGNPAVYTIDTATILLQEPAKKGFYFAGWYDAETNEKVTKITKGSTGNKALLAVWNPYKYYIKLDGNNADRGDMSDYSKSSRDYGAAYQLAANGYEKDGYLFKGWNTKADGSGKIYADGEFVKNLTTTDGAIVTLYAQWEKKK